jgi:hypothetical protein
MINVIRRILAIEVLLLAGVVSGCHSFPPVNGYHGTAVQGYTVLINADFAAERPDLVRRVRAALNEDLRFVNNALPHAARAAVRSTIVWVERESPSTEGFSGRGVTYHVSPRWLADHHFRPDKAQGIEVCNAEDYLNWRNHQMCILHEFCHAYHFVLGYDRSDVAETYGAARKAGLYRQVRYVLAGPDRLRRAYALNNPREYFAELSEAYLGRNDYFPFTRDELRSYDPEGFKLIGRLWRLSPEEIRHERQNHNRGDY